MKLIILLIAASLLSYAGYTQPCDSISTKDINHDIATGLQCCELLTVCDSIQYLKDSIIIMQQDKIAMTEEQYDLKHGSWLLADSLYTATARELTKSQSEFKRVRKGKRNWKGVGFILFVAIVGETYFISQQTK